MLERTLSGVYLFSLKDLRSFSAAYDAAAELISADPEIWQWLVDLKVKTRTDNATFRSYPKDVLTHVGTYGAERVKAALKYTHQKPKLNDFWRFFLDRVTREVAKPQPSTDRVSSKEFSGRAARRDVQSEADRYKEPYPDAWSMANLLANAPTTGKWGKP